MNPMVSIHSFRDQVEANFQNLDGRVSRLEAASGAQPAAKPVSASSAGSADTPNLSAGQLGHSADESGSAAFYRIRVNVCGDDRLSCSAHLRKLADMIMESDAPGWSTSDVNGSSLADRMPPMPARSGGQACPPNATELCEPRIEDL